MTNKTPFFPRELIAFVARSAGITADDLRGRRKFAIFVRARAVVIKIMIERGFSYSATGRLLGRHYSTIMHTIDTFGARYGNDKTAQTMLDYARYEFLDNAGQTDLRAKGAAL